MFKAWYPKGSDVAARFYFGDGEFIGKRANKLMINALTTVREHGIRSLLLEHDIDIDTLGLRELHDALESSGLLERRRGRGRTQHSGPKPTRNKRDIIDNITFANFGAKQSHQNYGLPSRTQESLYRESLQLDPSTAPFRPATRKNVKVIIDHREPQKLIALLASTGLHVTVGQLAAGDILITNDEDSKNVTLIERKTTLDLRQAITGDSKRAHKQVEKYYDSMVASAREGVSLKVVWIYEGILNESGEYQGVYNSLDHIKQVDGWINYVTAIAGQYQLTSFSTEHTAYIVAKLIQGVSEKELFYPVKVEHAGRVDKSRSERNAMTGMFDKPIRVEEREHGVIRPDDGLRSILALMPGINRKVANALADTGRSLNEITAMSQEELRAINGIGEVTAKLIFNTFNQRQPN